LISGHGDLKKMADTEIAAKELREFGKSLKPDSNQETRGNSFAQQVINSSIQVIDCVYGVGIIREVFLI